MVKFRNIVFHRFIFVLFLVLGIRTLKYRLDFPTIFNSDFGVDLIIAGSLGAVIELIRHYTRRLNGTDN